MKAQRMSEIVAFKLTPQELRRLQKYAKKTQRPTSNVIRLALSVFLKKEAGAANTDTGADTTGSLTA